MIFHGFSILTDFSWFFIDFLMSKTWNFVVCMSRTTAYTYTCMNFVVFTLKIHDLAGVLKTMKFPCPGDPPPWRRTPLPNSSIHENCQNPGGVKIMKFQWFRIFIDFWKINRLYMLDIKNPWFWPISYFWLPGGPGGSPDRHTHYCIYGMSCSAGGPLRGPPNLKIGPRNLKILKCCICRTYKNPWFENLWNMVAGVCDHRWPYYCIHGMASKITVIHFHVARSTVFEKPTSRTTNDIDFYFSKSWSGDPRGGPRGVPGPWFWPYTTAL